MRILHAAWQPEGYGIGTLLRDLVTFQNSPEGGLTADVVFHAGAVVPERFARTGGQVFSLGAVSARDPRLLPRLYAAMRGYDALLLHTPSPWAVLAARLRRLKTVYIFHGATGQRGKVGDLPRRSLQRHFIQPSAAALTFASDASYEKYCRVFGEPPQARTARFPYGLAVKDVRALRSREEVRRELGLEGGFAVGTAVRLAPEKALERLMEAAALLPREEAWHVLIAGSGPPEVEGPLREQAAKLGLGETVRFLGYRDDCRDIINALDLFVLPSREEPFGLALLEAMALGVPAAAFADGGGAVEILGDAGFTALKPADLAGFAGRLRREPALAERCSLQAKARAAELDVSQMARRLRELLK